MYVTEVIVLVSMIHDYIKIKMKMQSIIITYVIYNSTVLLEENRHRNPTMNVAITLTSTI